MIKDYKLYLGDNVEVMRKEIKNESIDFILTSPPYDDLRTYNDTCVWNFDVFKNVANELYRILKNGSVLVWVVGDCTKEGDESGTSFKQALYFKEIGFKLGDTMIYEKNGCGACGNNNFYIQNFEYMFVLTKGDIKTHNLLYDRDNINPCGKNVNGNRTKDTCDNGRSYKYYEQKEKGRRFNIWKYNSSEGDKWSKNHPAPFPEKLAKDHILSWSNEGDIILDPFCGSGTVGKMALINNRNFIGIEKVEKYYNLAKERINNSIVDIFDL